MNRNPSSVSPPLEALIRASIARSDGWLPFDRFMAMALYAPGLGYYANASRKFGAMPSSGSDFVTAPEMSPLFGRALAVQLAEALERTGTSDIWEFGAGSGALAETLLDTLGERARRYRIVEVSASLRERQRARLARFGARVEWADELPASFEGVVVGNEVLDAMPVKLIVRKAGTWHERGVDASLRWADRPTLLRPPVEVAGAHDYLTEVHPQHEAFIRTLADRLVRGAAFFIDYGFPEAEYYHPQRSTGTLMCHKGHRADPDPLSDIGGKDITAHVNFTGIAVAAQDAGFATLGYATQARFLLNTGIVPMMEGAGLADRAAAMRLIAEHEMGELFKVLALHKGDFWDAVGFRDGDRTHTL